jgi:hypothetical protein
VYHSGGSPAPPEADIVLFPNTVLFDRKVFASRRIRGSHMVRDPRDLVVSAYFYHLRTDEAWVHAPREDLNGQSYQQYLQAASKHEGLMAEIRRLSRGGFPAMAAWDYDQPDFHEMRYEDLLADEPAEFRALFDSYGFTPAAAERATARAVALSAASRASGASGHMRSGRPGEWHEHLDADHLAAIDAAAGELIRRLGYPA